MMEKTPKKAVILAAGFGSRMRDLTKNTPKPLLKLAGRAIIDWIIDDLISVGVTDVFVNTHYLSEKIEDHLVSRTDVNIHVSFEDEILETGGGVKKIINLIGEEDFFVLNGDVVWRGGSALHGLSKMWDKSKMELLLMLYPKDKLPDNSGLLGDYDINDTGQLFSSVNAKYIFAGPRIVSSSLFEKSPEGAFSFKYLFDKAESNNSLYGYVHENDWFHLGTPEELEYANNVF